MDGISTDPPRKNNLLIIWLFEDEEHYRDVTWHPKSLAVQLFVQQANKNLNIKSPILLTLCEGNPPVTSGFPTQRVSNVESVTVVMVSSCCWMLPSCHGDTSGIHSLLHKAVYFYFAIHRIRKSIHHSWWVTCCDLYHVGLNCRKCYEETESCFFSYLFWLWLSLTQLMPLCLLR